MTDKRTIAWTLSKAAQILPPAERQKFREFLAGLPGGKPANHKRHSWTRKTKKPYTTAKVAKLSNVQKTHRTRQLDLFD